MTIKYIVEVHIRDPHTGMWDVYQNTSHKEDTTAQQMYERAIRCFRAAKDIEAEVRMFGNKVCINRKGIS